MQKTLLVFLSAFAFMMVRAQSPRLSFDHIGVYEGLPESQINALLQDKLGYIWIGTQNGLVRYDGYQTKVYRFGFNDKRNHPTCNIISVVEGKNGDLWVGTYLNGLFRYLRKTDTFEQIQMPKQQGKSIATAIITLDKEGNVWLERVVGKNMVLVDRVDPVTKRFTTFGRTVQGSHHIDATLVMGVAFAEGQIWLRSNNGLYAYNQKTDKLIPYFATTDTAKQAAFFSVLKLDEMPGYLFGIVNISKHSTLFSYKVGAKNYTLFQHNDKNPNSIAGDTVFTCYRDRSKRNWVGTNKGLSLFMPQTGQFINYNLDKKYQRGGQNSVSGISSTHDNKLWLQTSAGLMLFDPRDGSFTHYPAVPGQAGSPVANYPRILFVDSTNTLWTGYNFNGVDHVDKIKSAFKNFKQLTGKDSTLLDDVACLTAAKDGSCIFSFGHILVKYNPANQSITKLSNAKSNHFGALVEGDDNKLYYDDADGLTIYDELTSHSAKISMARLFATKKSNHINSLFKDRHGVIWIGSTERGICSYNPLTKNIKRYPFVENDGFTVAKNTLDDISVLCVYEDRAGIIWVGTNNGGLNRLDPKTDKFVSYYKGANRVITCVPVIYETNNGDFWVGTYLNGLFKFDRKTGTIVKNYTEKDGLLLNSIIMLSEDATGNLWGSSERGLFMLNKAGLFKSYPQATMSQLATFVKLSNGTFVVGQRNGILTFDPANLMPDPNAPLVHIETITHSNPRSTTNTLTTLQAFGRTNIELPWKENRLTFNYVSLHYSESAKNTYAYMLEGYDKTWIKAGTDRSVTYTNLPPRNYIFRVKAANSDGIWNKVGDSIAITINWPWWFTWWAWIIYLALFVLAIYSFIKYRSRKLKRENLLLEQKIEVRTHQLSEANKELSEQREEITTQRDRLAESVNELKATQTQLIQSEKMASLGELTAGIAHEIQNPLNFVNNFSEVNTELIDEMQEEMTKGDYEEAKAIANDIKENQIKISQHGKRADFIVKGMLQHSRTSTGERQPTDINVLADEFLKLSYHGLRAKDKSFNAELVRHFDNGLPKVNMVQQDIGRVLLNLFNNAFYAVNQRSKTAGGDYKPGVTVRTVIKNDNLEISVKDNGNGIPHTIKDKIMQPFFTTKPTGEGTGLGLSLSYDIVVKGHGGKLEVNTNEGEYTEFIVKLPL